MTTPTGEQYELTVMTHNRQSRAIITEVAAGLRALTLGGVEVVESFPATTTPPYGAGIVLVPWPNRVADGRWQLDGKAQQLDLTEPARHNAIHGLLRYTAYRVVERSESTITLSAAVYPQHGYPFLLETSVNYELAADELRVTHEIVNRSDAAAPVAVGAHPYLRLGDVPIDELTLEVAATTHFEVDDRLNPVAEHEVAGTPFDLRTPSLIGGLELDDGFGGVGADSVHRLTAPDGRSVELFSGPEFEFVQVFTNRRFPKHGGTELAIAIEPMTAPAGALASGRGLTWLEPGERWVLSWGIRYSGLVAAG